jgi:hypothetical protein
VLKAIASLDFDIILRGVPINIGSLSAEKLVVVGHLAAHCILNGPVGVGKDTVFPTGERGSIKNLIGVATLSNSSWKALCLSISEEMMKMDTLKQIIAGCSQVRQKGKIWPLAG